MKEPDLFDRIKWWFVVLWYCKIKRLHHFEVINDQEEICIRCAKVREFGTNPAKRKRSPRRNPIAIFFISLLLLAGAFLFLRACLPEPPVPTETLPPPRPSSTRAPTSMPRPTWTAMPEPTLAPPTVTPTPKPKPPTSTPRPTWTVVPEPTEGARYCCGWYEGEWMCRGPALNGCNGNSE